MAKNAKRNLEFLLVRAEVTGVPEKALLKSRNIGCVDLIWPRTSIAKKSGAREMVFKRGMPLFTELLVKKTTAAAPSSALASEPLERLRFVPMGCQRLHLTVLPQVTDDAALGRVWKPVPSTTKRFDRRRKFRWSEWKN